MYVGNPSLSSPFSENEFVRVMHRDFSGENSFNGRFSESGTALSSKDRFVSLLEQSLGHYLYANSMHFREILWRNTAHLSHSC